MIREFGELRQLLYERDIDLKRVEIDWEYLDLVCFVMAAKVGKRWWKRNPGTKTQLRQFFAQRGMIEGMDVKEVAEYIAGVVK